MKNPYRHADREISRLKVFINATFSNAANEMPFDEMNVISVKKQMVQVFRRLNLKNKQAFERIIVAAYTDATEEAANAGYINGKKLDQFLFLAALLSRVDPVTGYIYNTEVGRKRDRLGESIYGSTSRQKRREAYRKGAHLWQGQTEHYADDVTDRARQRAFEDAGVERVRWVTEHDARVCSECRSLDGMIFRLDEVPDKPHYRCRCTLHPVNESES